MRKLVHPANTLVPISLIVLIPTSIYTKTVPTHRIWHLIPAICYLLVFTIGMGMILATLNVFFRDIQYIYRAVTTAWMYLTPIFYPVEQVPANIQLIIKVFNPLYYYVAQLRDVVLYGQIPGPRIFWGGWFLAFIMLIIGVWSFQRSKDKFILYI